MNKQKLALAIDGNCLMYRCFFATLNQLEYYRLNNLPPVNALNLFISSILKILQRKNYQYGIVAFDAGKTTFRNEQYEGYKKDRKPMPSELLSQLPLIQNAIEPLGLNKLMQINYEADDLIGSFKQLMNQNNIAVDIYTSDRDMLQLVDENTTVQMFKSGTSIIQEFNAQNFSELFYGLQPKQIPEYKGLAGDPADSIKGIAGIGHKMALKLLEKFKSINGIYENINDGFFSDKLRIKLVDNKSDALISRDIATICLDLLNDQHIDKFILKPINKPFLINLTNQYQLNSLRKIIENYKDE